MYIRKRNGTNEPIFFDKICVRLQHLVNKIPVLPNIDVTSLAQKVIQGIYTGISTIELDILASEISIHRMTTHPDYEQLASRIFISNLHKETSSNYMNVCKSLYIIDKPIVSDEFFRIVSTYQKEINDAIVYERDYSYEYFACKILEKTYLLRHKGKIIERPQHMLMRVAIGIHGDDIKKILKTYTSMSLKLYTMATPCLYNSGTPNQQMASCFLLNMREDSIVGIYDTLKQTAIISKSAGGIGLNVNSIRASGSHIAGTNGISSGIVPMLRVFNETSRYVDQGGGKRKGSFAMYIEPWHADIENFLQLKKNTGADEQRARDLFYALWIPDLFMKRVEKNGVWSLFCPSVCSALSDVYGERFEELYVRYEKEGKAIKTMQAQDLWTQITVSQIETGTPYMLYKDACNIKSNQKYLGTIRNSNLCVSGDTMILTDKGYYPILDLYDKNIPIRVWNGKEFSETTVIKTGTMQPLLDVHFSNHIQIKCTPYHKFYIETISGPKKIEAKDLQPSMKIIKYTVPTLYDLGSSMFSPYTHGYFCGYAHTLNGDKYDIDTEKTIRLHGNSKKILHRLKYKSIAIIDIDTIVCTLHENINDISYVPINCSINTKIVWLSGYYAACGYTMRNDTISEYGVVFSTGNLDFLIKVTYLLQTMGICVHIELNSTSSLPLYFITIRKDYERLKGLGFAPKFKSGNSVIDYVEPILTIDKIENSNRFEDTYCFDEPKEHKGVFNGVLLGNCAEIIQYSSPEEIAVCNLASVSLKACIIDGVFSHQQLFDITYQITENLDSVIDRNDYPLPEARKSNMTHRPIGIGIQGLADTFIILKYPFDSPEAKQLNIDIAETMYFAAATASCDMAKVKGPHKGFENSPAAKGILCPDMWNKTPSDRWDYPNLRINIKIYGTRNVLFLANMPTASTSAILGNIECMEPITSNIYNRRVLAGEFTTINNYLIQDLIKLGMWNETIKNAIIANDGSIANIQEIPSHIKKLYRTVWEISMRDILDMSADRGAYIDQSQSLNLYMEAPTKAKITSMHFYAWKLGLKTGMYYLRTRPAAFATKITAINTNIDPKVQKVCTYEPGCESCGS